MMRPVKVAPSLDAALDRLSRAVAKIARGDPEGIEEFDAATADALAALDGG
ncbi:hypothetical protein BH09ACT4_BH09ACT4_03980 [soil metagenome]